MEPSPTNSDKEVPMEDQDTTTRGEQKSNLTSGVLQGIQDEETINFENEGLFLMSPSFTCPISEENLQDDQCPFIMWAMLKFKILPNSANVEDAVFNSLTNFIDQAESKDKHFMVFPYNLSKKLTCGRPAPGYQ